MSKSPREYKGINVGNRRVAVPDNFGVATQEADGFDHVVLAVRPRKEHDADACHERVTVKSSITGLVRNRLHSSSTRPLAEPSSSASM